jgi:hypothetical protein
MDIGPTLVTNGQSAELVEPRKGRGRLLPLKLVDGIPLTLADGHCPHARRKTGRAMAIARMGGAWHQAMAIAP